MKASLQRFTPLALGALLCAGAPRVSAQIPDTVVVVNPVPAQPDEPVALADGARIRIGRAALRYAAPKPAAATTEDANGSFPPLLRSPHLNTRLDIDPDEPITIGRHVSLRVWVGAPLVSDGRQSSRPLKWSTLDRDPVALRVLVRVASPAWRVVAEEPTLLAAAWGTAQVARYRIVAQRAERTKLGVRVDLDETRSLIQYFRLGLSAASTNGTHTGTLGPRDQSGRLCCRRCGAAARAGARFCTRCGSAL